MKSPKVYNILIVDDEPEIHELIMHALDGVFLLPQKKSDADKRLGQMLGVEEIDSEKKIKPAYEVVRAFQAQQVLDIFADPNLNSNFDLIFLDIMMPPGKDGISLAENLVQIRPNLNIVFCSAYFDSGTDRIKKIANDTQACFLLSKPFTLSFLRQFINEFLIEGKLSTESNELKI